MVRTGSSDRPFHSRPKTVFETDVRFPAQPQRTCVGCKRRDAQSELLRIVRDADHGEQGAVVPDSRRRLPGRGAWLHPSTDCLALALKRRAFSRAFRAQVETAAVESFFPGPEPESTKEQRTVQTERQVRNRMKIR